MSRRIASPFGTVMLSSDTHDSALERLFGDDAPQGPARSPRTPAVDVYETPESVLVLVDLPGVTKQDIDLRYGDGMISISAEARGLQRDDGHWVMHERRVGRFVRGIQLGRTIDPKQVKARFTDGILELEIAKPRGGEKAVEIEVS